MDLNSQALTTAGHLKDILYLTQEEMEEIEQVRAYYPMRITPYYASLIGPQKGNSPIWLQSVPSMKELDNPAYFQDDPLNEEECSPVPYLTHKYTDRAAFYACNSCFMYCRHCTRKNTVIKSRRVSHSQFEEILRYLERTPQIRDVLVTGGDPLTLEDGELEYYISRLHSIPHVQTLRIGTRAPVAEPSRITGRLADTLSKYHPLWINTHFNHPDEVTPEAAEACNILLSRGIPLGNQTVLLKGVNDNIDIMEELVLKLIHIRVRPYYIYQCDQVRGTAHFHTRYQLGMEIIQQLRTRVSGYAVPRFVIDVPGVHGGKVTMEYNNLLRDEGDKLILRGWDGAAVNYINGGQIE